MDHECPGCESDVAFKNSWRFFRSMNFNKSIIFHQNLLWLDNGQFANNIEKITKIIIWRAHDSPIESDWLAGWLKSLKISFYKGCSIQLWHSCWTHGLARARSYESDLAWCVPFTCTNIQIIQFWVSWNSGNRVIQKKSIAKKHTL